jgi:two-component system, OmpR family, response regulator BasR
MKLLLAEDDLDLSYTLESEIKEMTSMIIVDSVSSISEFRAAIKSNKYNAILTDFNLQGGKVTNLLVTECRSIACPIIVMSGNVDLDDMALLINIGVSYFIKKPFGLTDLTSVINRLTRKQDIEFVCGGKKILLNARSMKCMVGKKIIELTTKEFLLLKIILENGETVTEREKITEVLWGDSSSDSNINSIVYSLKSKIPELKDRLRAIRGVGFRLETED